MTKRDATDGSMNFYWHSTPQFWCATRPDYDGAPDAGKAGRMGFGRTKEAAAADLLEQEADDE